MIFATAPSSGSLRFSGPETEVRIAGEFYSMEIDEVGTEDDLSIYGRNHQPMAFFNQFMAEFEDDTPSFTDDLTVDDYIATCKTQGGVEVIEYLYEKDGRRDVNVAEKTGLNRPLSGESVDPALQDNFRMSISYEAPTIAVDTSLPKAPLTWSWDIVDETTNARGGPYISGKVHEDSEWAPLSEFIVRLVDSGDGTVYLEEQLKNGFHDFQDGDIFRYNDHDSNAKISTGDTFIIDLGPGLDVTLFDKWASSEVMLDVKA